LIAWVSISKEGKMTVNPKDELILAVLKWADAEQAMFDAESGPALMHAMADSVQADGDLRAAVDKYRIEVMGS
jgi:hypothetical protein